MWFFCQMYLLLSLFFFFFILNFNDAFYYSLQSHLPAAAVSHSPHMQERLKLGLHFTEGEKRTGWGCWQSLLPPRAHSEPQLLFSLPPGPDQHKFILTAPGRSLWELTALHCFISYFCMCILEVFLWGLPGWLLPLLWDSKIIGWCLFSSLGETFRASC